MTNRKKIMNVFICFVLMIILSGCSGGSEPTAKGEENEIRESSIEINDEEKDDNQDADNEIEPDEKDIEDEIVTVTLVEKDFTPSNPDDLAYIDKINETLLENGIKAKLELVDLPKGDYLEQLNLMIDGGTIPDIIWLRDGADIELAEQGLLLDLSEYVSDSDVFQKAMEPYNRSRISSYPYLLRIRYNTPKLAVVRKDWLDELNLPIPETVQDYYNVLKAFADSDFDHNGKKDTYGITVTGDTSRLDDIFNAAFSMPTTWIKDENGEYIYSKVSSYEKEKLAFYHRLLKENILDPEYVTTKWDTMEDKLYTGKVGMVIGSAGKVVEIYNTKLRNAGVETDLIPLNPPKGEEGMGFAPIDVSREEMGFAISADSPNKDIAFQVLEFMASDEGQFLDRLGFEGRDYEVDINGNITRTEKAEDWYARFFDVPSWESPVPLLSELGKKSLDITSSYYVEDIIFHIPNELETNWVNMNNLYRKYSYKIINGEYDIDKFDEFVLKWYEAGGDEITTLAREELD